MGHASLDPGAEGELVRCWLEMANISQLFQSFMHNLLVYEHSYDEGVHKITKLCIQLKPCHGIISAQCNPQRQLKADDNKTKVRPGNDTRDFGIHCIW